MKQVIIIFISIFAGIMLFCIGVLVYALNGHDPFGWGLRDRENADYVCLALEYEAPAETVRDLQILYNNNPVDVYFYRSSQDKIEIKEYAYKELAEGEKTTVEEKGGALIVNGKRRGKLINFGFFGRDKNGGYAEVYLPDTWQGNLQVQTVSGDISSQIDFCLGTEADFEASSTSGEIFLTKVEAGKINVSSTSGDLRIEDAKGDVKLATTSGEITLFTETGDCGISTISGDICVDSLTGDFRFSSTSGEISAAQVTGVGKVSTVSGDISLQFKALQGELTLSSTSGEVSVGLPRDTALNFRAATTSGEIHTFFDEFLSFNKRGSSAQGVYGEGTAHIIDIHTTSGDVSIRED